MEKLPTLYPIRMWTQEINPSYMTFVDEMRAAGHEVIDIFEPHQGHTSLDDWVAGVTERLFEHWQEGTPLHLIGYCGGGDLLITALPVLERRGIRADYVGFIDIRTGRQGEPLRRGLYSLYQIPWSARIWRQMMRLTPPNRETLGAVLKSVLRRSYRSVLEFPQRGWRSKKRRIPSVYEQSWLEYRCSWPSVKTAAHLYICPQSVDRYTPGDPSVGAARTLQGGFVIRSIGGNHETCIEPPHSTDLIERIIADRCAVVSGIGAFQ